jgi:ABC-type dipeptide/oligopeptide/nickel transport system permease component
VLAFVVKKVFFAIITFFVLLSLSFFMLRVLPGSPFDQERALAPEIIKNLELKYGLNKSLPDQYLSYMKRFILSGDLGPSLKYPNRKVWDILKDAFPVSLSLGFIALMISVFFGILIGSISAAYPKSLASRIGSLFTDIGMSMPSFVFALILIGFFGLYLNLLPVALWEAPQHVILPALTLSIAPCSYISRLTKTSLEEVLTKGHIQTAKAKGLEDILIISRHGLRNSLGPILSIIGPIAAILITGSFVVEHVFAIPGMGKYFVSAFINRDYFLISGVIVIYSSVILIINNLVELALYILNPRK